VAVVLVIGAGLLIRTVYNLANVDLGFNRSRLVTFSIFSRSSKLENRVSRGLTQRAHRV
jgi:hypothetical protein